jgi:adenosylhomocysteine nucleosidase
VRVLLICPIPLEYTSCRNILSLRDAPRLIGCRAARGSLASVDILALESGPAKARAASGTVAGIFDFKPDLVVDTGTCGALDGDLIVNGIVFAQSCLEYDISGNGMPSRIIPEMRLPSAIELLPRREGEKLVRSATELGKNAGFHVRAGLQACGELFIQSTTVRESLRAVTGALACNWETAGVFIGALRAGVPPLSIRSVSDLGDEDSLKDFRRNAKASAQGLYGLLRVLFESGWFVGFLDRWRGVARDKLDRMAQFVLP